MAREKGLYRRQDSPYWWIKTVLPDGRRVCKSTRLIVLEDAEECLIRLKAEAYEAARTGIPVEQKWQTAVLRYLEDNADKRSLPDDKDHLLKLDPDSERGGDREKFADHRCSLRSSRIAAREAR